MLAWLALAELLAACATAEPRPGPEIHSLQILGTDKVPERDIKKKILTSEPGSWPWSRATYFDPNAWQADLRRIERYYQARGYYQAEIVDEKVVPHGKDAVDVLVKVREGEPTTISKLEVHGLEEVPAEVRDEALKSLPLSEGAIFHEDDWVGVKSKIRGNLHELGYAEATVGGEVRVDTLTRTAQVNLEVTPGQRYRFGQIFVVTDPHPQVGPKLIVEMAELAVAPGHIYSERALADAQSRVFKMGVFGGVKVNRGAPDRASATVPVIIDVREAPFKTVRAGGGVGIDQTRNEARASAEYTDRNFLGGLRRFTARLRVGYAFIPSVFSVVSSNNIVQQQQGVVFNAGMEFEQPRFFLRDLRLQLSVGAERGIEEAYRYIGGRAKVGVIWQPHPAFSVFPSYNFEAYRLEGVALPGGTAPELVLGCQQGAICTLSYLEQVFEWDRRNFERGDPLEPKRGYYAALALQEGGGPLQGSFSFIRVLPEVRYYTSFLAEDRFTVSAKLRLGSLIPFSGESPIVSRFFSGGTFMRGFSARQLSPFVLVAQDPHTTTLQDAIVGVQQGQVVPVGGDGLLEGSLELRYQLTDKIVLATFFDFGFVTIDSFFKTNGRFDPDYIWRNLLYAVGLGVRYLTVVGPIRVDVGYRLPVGPPLPFERISGQQTLTLPALGGCFGLFTAKSADFGGSPQGVCNLQISVGEAF